MREKKKPGRGQPVLHGEGSTVPKSYTIPAELAEWLASRAEQRNVSASAELTNILRRARANSKR